MRWVTCIAAPILLADVGDHCFGVFSFDLKRGDERIFGVHGDVVRFPFQFKPDGELHPHASRTLPASEVHISTTGHRASTLESRILAWESKDRYRAIWKTRESLKSTRRRPCDCQSPPARYHSSRPDRNRSWALLSRFQAVRRARFGRPAADRLHRSYRPSALSYLSIVVPQHCRTSALSYLSNCQPLRQALRRARAQRSLNAN